MFRHSLDLRIAGLVVLLVSCGGPAEPAAAPAADPPPVRREAAPRSTRCPATIDAKEILARNARAFGSAEAIARVPLRELPGATETEGQAGKTSVILSASTFRTTSQLGGVVDGRGIDRESGWELAGGSGIVERLRGAEEEVDVRFDDWFWRRKWLAGGETKATCTNDGLSGAHVDLVFARPEIGSPVLSFDVDTAALVEATHTQCDGRNDRVSFDAWSDADATGVHWPSKTISHSALGGSTTTIYERARPNASCVKRNDQGELSLREGPECAEIPESPSRVRWPASGRVKLPLAFVRRSLLVRAKASGRELDALLDSGASIMVIDSTTPAASLFKPAAEITGSSSTQAVKAGIGELSTIGLGELVLGNAPTAAIPIPALDALGKRRPELILGYTLFAAGVVRIDYARSEVVLAKPGTALASPNARSVPVRIAEGKLLAQASIEGQTAWFEVDTGNSGAIDPYRKWSEAHGIPGNRPVTKALGRFGAGQAHTTAHFYRLRSATLGPIDFSGGLVHDADPSDTGMVAGLVGNALFARCDAIVIDHDARKLYFEGACNRSVPENKIMWRFLKKDDKWEVDLVVPGSSIDAAGIKEGDVVLEVGGRPIGDDPTALEPLETQADGTKVPVVLERAGTKRRVVVELKRLVP
jgi:hypothetical protein